MARRRLARSPLRKARSRSLGRRARHERAAPLRRLPIAASARAETASSPSLVRRARSELAPDTPPRTGLFLSIRSAEASVRRRPFAASARSSTVASRPFVSRGRKLRAEAHAVAAVDVCARLAVARTEASGRGSAAVVERRERAFATPSALGTVVTSVLLSCRKGLSKGLDDEGSASSPASATLTRTARPPRSRPDRSRAETRPSRSENYRAGIVRQLRSSMRASTHFDVAKSFRLSSGVGNDSHRRDLRDHGLSQSALSRRWSEERTLSPKKASRSAEVTSKLRLPTKALKGGLSGIGSSARGARSNPPASPPRNPPPNPPPRSPRSMPP